MGRKKAAKHSRNKVLTEADFINEAIEEIVTNGFKDFTGTEVAGRVGRHSSRINDLFGSKKGLIKAAVKARDHWELLFKKYKIPAGASGKQIKETFIAMMSENLTSFKENKAMQHMILGQMTVYHEALREVCDYKELEGAKMLAHAAPHFEASGVYFDVLMCILLHGSYGMVLQSEAIGGTAAGIDLNIEEHMRRAQFTIRYLIELVWRDGGLKSKRAKSKHFALRGKLKF